MQALLICSVFGILASFAGVALFFLFEPITFAAGLWVLFFLGSAITPTCFGIIISSVPKSKQSASFAFGQLFFNINGFFLAPNVSGYIMDQYVSPKEGLIMGYRFLLGWNMFTLLFILLATAFSYRNYRKRYMRTPKEDVELKDINIEGEADDQALNGSKRYNTRPE